MKHTLFDTMNRNAVQSRMHRAVFTPRVDVSQGKNGGRVAYLRAIDGAPAQHYISKV